MHGRMSKGLYGDRGDAEKWVGAVRQQDDYKVTWLFLLITTLRQKKRMGPLHVYSCAQLAASSSFNTPGQPVTLVSL